MRFLSLSTVFLRWLISFQRAIQATAPDLAQLFLDNIVQLHGFPRSIVSDRDTRFLSNFWRELFALTETTLRFLTANHPQTDGQTERTNRKLEQYLRLYVRYNPARWSQYLTTAEIAYNSLTHSSTGMSPFYLVYQRHINLPLDFSLADLESKNTAIESLLHDRQSVLARVRDALAQARERMIKHNKDKMLQPPFKIDDQVLVHRAAFRKSAAFPDLNKFDDRWYGPYTILKIINQNAYQLQLPSSFRHHDVINVTFLRLYRVSTRFPRTHPDAFFLPPVRPDTEASDSKQTDENDESDKEDVEKEYEAESILDCRLIRHKRGRPKKQTLQQQLQISTDPNDYEFLVKWKGYPVHDATWEPYLNLTNMDDILHDFVTAKQLPISWAKRTSQNQVSTRGIQANACRHQHLEKEVKGGRMSVVMTDVYNNKEEDSDIQNDINEIVSQRVE